MSLLHRTGRRGRVHLLFGVIAVAVALGVTGLALRGSDPVAAVEGNLVIEVVIDDVADGAPHAFEFDVTGEASFDVTVTGESEETTATEEGTYTITFLGHPSYDFEGWTNAGAGETCPSVPGGPTAGALSGVQVPPAGNVRVCAYVTAEVETGTIRVEKANTTVADDFEFDIRSGVSIVDTLFMTGGGGDDVSIPLETTVHTITEDLPSGFTFEGWIVDPNGGECPSSPANFDSESNPLSITPQAGEEILVCAYNSETTTGTLRIVKMGGAEGVTFTIDIDENPGGADVDTLNVEVDGPDQDDRDATIDLPPGSYTLEEIPNATYGFLGWAGAQAGGTVCGGNATTTTDTLNVNIFGGQELTVCVYNAVGNTPGTLEITKVGGQSGDSFIFDITDADLGQELEDEQLEIELTSAASSSTENIELPPGDYAVIEQTTAGYTFDGWAVKTDDTCPANPTSATPTRSVDILPGQTTRLCAYNVEEDSGALQIFKIGGNAAETFVFDIVGENANRDVAVDANDDVTQELDPGMYEVTELEADGHIFLGWIVLPAGTATCPTTVPNNLDEDATIEVEIELAETTVLCAYNAEVTEIEVALYVTWTNLAWLGPDVDIDDAISGDLSNAQATGDSDISDRVTAIWYWNAAEQDYEGFFPGSPAASDFTEFETGESYWIAINDDGPDPLLWQVLIEP